MSDYSVRDQLLIELMRKVEADTYPSATLLDMTESLLGPDEAPAYAEILLTKVRRQDRFPSIPLLYRVQRLAG